MELKINNSTLHIQHSTLHSQHFTLNPTPHCPLTTKTEVIIKMNEKYISTLMVSGSLGVIFSSVFGEWNNDVLALIILMAIDFITGIITAAAFQKSSKSETGGLSSKAAFKGIAKKVCEMMLVAVAYQSEVLLHVDYIRAAVIWALCAAEIISITENAADMDILPESVRKIFDNTVRSLNKSKDE